jgi:hypothetical protein
MSTSGSSVYIAPPASPEVLDFEAKVKKFVEDHYKKLTKAHYTHTNTVYYHRCCNTFTTKGSPARQGHTESQTQTLSEFFGKTQKQVTLDLMLKRCLQVTQELPGSRSMLVPTLNQPHQEHTLLDKRLAEAEAEAAEAQADPTARVNSFRVRLAQVRKQKDLAEAQAENQKTIIDQKVYENTMLTQFLIYNNIDPLKVLTGWRPVDGVGETITLRWPAYCTDEAGDITPKL